VTQRSRHGRTTETRADGQPKEGRAKQRAFCIAVLEAGDDLSELRELLRTAGVAVVGQEVQHREKPHPNTYLGPGKLVEVKALAKAGDANVIACDDELTPRQERNLEQATGMPVIFSRDDRGKATGLTTHFLGATFSYERISDQPPKAYEAPKPRVAIKLDTKLLDACVGLYEFAPDAAFPTGIKATIRREGDQLLWQVRGEKVVPGPFNVYPESETNFFIKVHSAQLTFIKNDKGEVTAVSLNDDAWLPDGVGKKLKKE